MAPLTPNCTPSPYFRLILNEFLNCIPLAYSELHPPPNDTLWPSLHPQVLVFPTATKTPSGALDVARQDLSVSASLGQLRVVLLFLFVNRVLDYLKGFNVSDQTISSAKESARKTAGDAVASVSVPVPA